MLIVWGVAVFGATFVLDLVWAEYIRAIAEHNMVKGSFHAGLIICLVPSQQSHMLATLGWLHRPPSARRPGHTFQFGGPRKMTTVTYKDGVMACDSCWTCD